MTKITKYLLIYIYLLINLFINPIEPIDAPFISKLEMEFSNGKVLLQWQNPINFDQYLTIYRSENIIDSIAKLKKSEKIVLLTNKEEKYIDTLAGYGSYYYAVIITDKSTMLDNQILVPYRNFTLNSADNLESFKYQFIKFTANSEKDDIKLEWDYTTNSKTSIKAMIFRNTVPITNEEILKDSIKIATSELNSKLYIDSPMSNIDYYYAIFVESEKDKTFVPDVNITTNPVTLLTKDFILPEFSNDNFIPLPLLTIKIDPKTSKPFLDPQILKSPIKIPYNKDTMAVIKETKLSFNDIYNEFSKLQLKKLERIDFHILEDEDIFETIEYSQEYNNAIKYIQEKKYDKALFILEELSKEILPDDLSVRIMYYLGQIYYLKHNYYVSYIYLIYSYSSYKKEIEPYLYSIYQSVFPKLER